jgi:hypothetical protein
MLTLEFKDELTESRFTGGNMFLYGVRKASGIIYSGGEKELPYIFRTSGGYHKDNELFFCLDTQFRNRRLDNAKVKEILDSARMPIRITSTSGVNYYIGKGFVGILRGGQLHTLFIAVCKKGLVTDMGQVKFIVSRELYTDEHKKMWSILSPIVYAHPGDVIITANMRKYIGINLEMPTFTTISQKMEYNRRLINYCAKSFKTSALPLANE